MTAPGSKLPVSSAIAIVPAAPAVATGSRKRACCSAVPSARTAGTNWLIVGEQRPGCERASELLDHDGELDRAEPEAAARGLRDRQRGPAELDHVGPEPVGVGRLPAVRASTSSRTTAGEHSAASTVRTVARSSSWSAVKSSSMPGARYPTQT